MDITFNFEEKTFMELEELENQLKNELYTSPNAKPLLDALQTYIATFHYKVIDALYEFKCPSGALPYRGEITIDNLSELFVIMPDLYDYLKIQYSAIESGGDVIINDILDATKNGKTIDNYSKYETYFTKYIADNYYFDYLRGTLPVPFSVSNLAPNIDVEYGFPRELYWWKQYDYEYFPMPMETIQET